MDKNYKNIKIKTNENVDNTLELESSPGPMEEPLVYEFNYDLKKFKKYNKMLRLKRK